MSIRILYDADMDYAVLYCSVHETAHPPIFHGSEAFSAKEMAQAFLAQMKKDGETNLSGFSSFRVYELAHAFLSSRGKEDEYLRELLDG